MRAGPSLLFGAWALSGESVDRLFPHTHRRAVLESFGASAGDAETSDLGCLWLVAERGKSHRDGQDCLAIEGFLAPVALEEGRPADLLASVRGLPRTGPAWDGHYALAYARPADHFVALFCDPNGGERLYYARWGGLFLFASSLRTILAVPGFPRRADAETARECALSHFVAFGSKTLCEGIEEVTPGQAVCVTGGLLTRGRPDNPLLEPPIGDLAGSPAALRLELTQATARALDGAGRAAVALSGGVDSSTIAACAVDLLGPRRVCAYSYRFDDATHVDDGAAAAAVARRLGVEHRVLRLSFDEYARVFLETAWRDEWTSVRYPAQYLWLMRQAGKDGFRTLLAGHGIEQMLGGLTYGDYFAQLARRVPGVPWPDRFLSEWKLRRFHCRPWKAFRRPLHPGWPGLEAPMAEIYFFTLCVLRHNGLLRSVARFYPEEGEAMVEAAAEAPSVREAVRTVRHFTLERQFERLSMDAILAPNLSKFVQKATREEGCRMVNPAFFASCVGLSARFQGKRPPADYRSLQREAMKDRLPESVLNRPKLLGSTAISNAWRERINGHLLDSLGGTLDALRPRMLGGLDFARRRFPGYLAPLALTHRLVVEMPGAPEPPTWEAVCGGSPAQAASFARP